MGLPKPLLININLESAVEFRRRAKLMNKFLSTALALGFATLGCVSSNTTRMSARGPSSPQAAEAPFIRPEPVLTSGTNVASSVPTEPGTNAAPGSSKSEPEHHHNP